MKLLLLIICFVIGVGPARALRSSTDCGALGSEMHFVDDDSTWLEGAPTGIFYREAFPPNRYRKIETCMTLPTSLDRKRLERYYGPGSDGHNPDQLPYNYLGAQLGSQLFEAGIYYFVDPKGKEPSGYKLFTANFDHLRMKYYNDFNFSPGDRVCMSLEYSMPERSMVFTVNGSLSRIGGRPLNHSLVVKQTAVRPMWFFRKLEFKRVTGLATRAVGAVKAPRTINEGLTAERLEDLFSAGVYSEVIWHNAYGTTFGENRSAIEQNDYYFGKNFAGECSKTNAWPQMAVQAFEFSGGLRVRLLPPERKSLAIGK